MDESGSMYASTTADGVGAGETEPQGPAKQAELTPPAYVCCCGCTLIPVLLLYGVTLGSFLGSGMAGDGAFTTLSRVPLSAYKGAVCNDGSVADYYFAPATDTAKSNLWITWLQGGAWCNDDKSCADRWANTPAYMTSKDHTDTMDLGKGVMAPSDPTFGGANMAEVVFCTSDGHMGDTDGRKDKTAEASPTNGWHFKGQRVSIFCLLSSNSP